MSTTPGTPSSPTSSAVRAVIGSVKPTALPIMFITSSTIAPITAFITSLKSILRGHAKIFHMTHTISMPIPNMMSVSGIISFYSPYLRSSA